MSTPDPGRATLTARLRAMADWLDAHPDLPVNPYAAVTIHYFPDDPKALNNVQHATLDSHWKRYGTGWDMLSHYADDDERGPWIVEYRVSIKKPEVHEDEELADLRRMEISAEARGA